MPSMRIAGLALAVLVVTAPLRAQNESRGNPRIGFEGQSIDDMIATFMAEHDVPGMSLAIVQAPYVTRATGHGFGDAQRKTLVSVNTMFDVADMRNAFTAVAVMQLVEEGKLDLQSVLTLIRTPAESARLEQLVATASGQSYEQFVRRNQLDRLGLKHTFFGSELAQAAREELKPGDRHQRFLHEPALIDPAEPAVAAGGDVDPRGIYASASDVSVWDIGLAGDILIRDPALRKLLYDPASGASSGPWFFPGRPGLMIATGSGHGFSSLLSRFTHRDELLCVTLLANREGLDLTQLARRIAGAHNAKLGPPSKARGLRVQQSPWPARESVARLDRALRELGVTVTAVDLDHGTLATELGPFSAWEEDGQVWLTATDPSVPSKRKTIDGALLRAVTMHAD